MGGKKQGHLFVVDTKQEIQMGLGMVFQMGKIHAPKLLDHEQTEKRGVLCGVDKKDSRSVRFGENSKNGRFF